jgi:type III secretion protein F
MNVGMSTSISFNYLNDTVMAAYSAREQDLRTSVTTLRAKGPDVSNVDLLDLQTKVQQWSLMSSLQSTLTKELGDAMKGIVQKAA